MAGLERYGIEGELGRGAMGVVYRAWDTTLDRAVALKELVFPHGLNEAAQQDMVARFLREARAAARLQHPNVVQVFDVFSQDGRHFIAMEMLTGAPLGDLLERGAIGPQAAMQVLLQVLDAVQAAHDAGIVHRDLKPDNIYVLEDGRVKVTDFGIAKLMDNQSATNATQMGTILGTPGYMAPEQVQGLHVDSRADIFAIGVIGCELYGGSNPFLANSPTATLYRIVNEQPAIPAGTPPQVAAVLNKALQKDPAMRYQRAAEMSADLRSGVAPTMVAAPAGVGVAPTIVAGQHPGAYAAPQAAAGGGKTWIIVTAVIGVIAVVGLLIFATGGGGGSAPPQTTAAATQPAQNEVVPADDTADSSFEPAPEPDPAPVEPAADADPATPFWGAFFYANEDRAAADTEAARLEAAGWPALVLDTADYSTIGKPGQSIWVVCSGPYSTEAEAADAASMMASGGFSGAYAKRVDR